MICKGNFRVASDYVDEKFGISTILKPIANAKYKTVTTRTKEEELSLVKDFHELSNDIFLLLQLLDLGIIGNNLKQATATTEKLYKRMAKFVKIYGPIKSDDDSQNLTSLLLDDEFMQMVLYSSFDKLKKPLDFLDVKDHASFPQRFYNTLPKGNISYQELKELRMNFLKDKIGMGSNIQTNQYKAFIDIYNLSPDFDDERPRRFSQKQQTPKIYTDWLASGDGSDLFATHTWAYYMEGIRSASNGSIEFNKKLNMELGITFNVNSEQWEIVYEAGNLLEAMRFYKFFGKDGQPIHITKCQLPECNKMIINARRTFCSNKHGVTQQNRARLFRIKQQKQLEEELSFPKGEAEDKTVPSEANKPKQKKKWIDVTEDNGIPNTVKVKK